MTTQSSEVGFDFNPLVAGIYEWVASLEAIGIHITRSAGLKAAKECLEYIGNPCPEEAADVIIAILGSCRSHGWGPGVIAAAIEYKMDVNRNRQWRQLPDGTFQHIEPPKGWD